MADNLAHIDIEEYYSKADKAKERKEAFFFFQDKYVKNPFDNYFIIEETSRFIARKIKFFVPGSIYTFQYQDPITKNILDFYDKRPMIIVVGSFVSKETGRLIMQGLNLNFVPEAQKVQLLSSYYKAFRSDLLNAERESDKGLMQQGKNMAKFLTDWTFMTKVFVNQAKIPLDFIVRNYDVSRIQNPVLIEIEDWPMIPFYVPREIAKVGIAKVYTDYITAKKQVNDKRKMIDPKRSAEIKKKYK